MAALVPDPMAADGIAGWGARIRRGETTIEATVEALVDCGYGGTTTQEVCRRTGCSRGTLLYHFPRREDLLVGALHFVLSSRVEDFVREHRDLQGLDPAGFP